MAINFMRLEFKSRCSQKTGSKHNAVSHSSYISRTRQYFEGTKFESSRHFNFLREKTEYSTVLIPNGIDEKFKDREYLWNKVEQSENRKDSQLYIDCVLALPDDECVSLEMRKEIALEVAESFFVSKGLAVQIDIHPPKNESFVNEETGESGGRAHNHHAHMMITTRTFTEDGKELHPVKPRNIFPTIRNGKVIGKNNCPAAFTEIQNRIFEKYGLELRVDHRGAVPQKHIGPVRMRARALDLMNENDQIIQENKVRSTRPDEILRVLTENQSVFTTKDLERFLDAHVAFSERTRVEEAFWNYKEVVQLQDKKSGCPVQRFSSLGVMEEEDKIIRISERLAGRCIDAKASDHSPYLTGLNPEQRKAFQGIVNGRTLSLIEGHAGTGKSYLLAALREKYESDGLKVRAFGPDNATARVLEERGFKNATTLHRTLFSYHFSKLSISKGKEVWLVDEAGKLGNDVLLELLKVAEKNKVHLVICGNSAQLPPVSRGGMLKVMVEKFGCQDLSDIQRQKSDLGKEVSKKLAVGEIGSAFDLISRTGGFRWFSTKSDSLEACAKAWAVQSMKSRGESSVIIANTNAEVKAINELVRSFRREFGEIDQKEFECLTTSGKLFVSQGDVIEFRKNDRDLGVVNGTRGILTKASLNKFIVTISDKGESREISFNPKKLNSFQLGYALTYNRSQGKSVDRAFVVASPMLNKEMFYVGLTRHVHDVTCFVSNEDARNLTHLKSLAMRSSSKETTHDYTCSIRDEKLLEGEGKEKKIAELKNSDSTLNRVKGHLFGMGAKFEEAILKRSDRKPDYDFYHPNLSKSIQKGSVRVVKEEYSVSEDSLEKTKEVLSLNRKESPVSVKHDSRKPFHSLSSENQKVLADYFSKSDHASSLYQIVCSESENRRIHKEETQHYVDWMKACSKRNEAAFSVLGQIGSEDLSRVLSRKSQDILYDRGNKHRDLQNSPKNLEEQLKGRLEELVFRLFPDGPSRRDSRGLRFGAKGSLSVVLTGEKSGTFFDFEERSGGGLLKLIEKTQSISSSDAKKWAKEFLGESCSSNVPDYYKSSNYKKFRESDWVSCVPPKDSKFPGIRIFSQSLERNYNLKSVHTYRNIDGAPIFYVARLEDKKTGHKLPLPISYGKSSDHDQERWALKGYSLNHGMPLYNLHLLRKHPDKPVLIVEGEKAADAGMNILGEKYNVISWNGGAQGTHKTDWTPLWGKEVVIWPDNDEAGFQACSDIEQRLKGQGVRSLKVVAKDQLSKRVPLKWDIADLVPAGVGKSFIKDTLLRAEERAVSIGRLMPLCDKMSVPDRSEQILLFNDVLTRVDSRMRKEGRFEGTTTKELNEMVLSETSRLIKDFRQTKDSTSLEVQSLLYRASSGKSPSDDQLNSFRKTLQSLSQVESFKKNPYSYHRAAYFINESGWKHQEAFNKRLDRYREDYHKAEIALANQVQKRIREMTLNF